MNWDYRLFNVSDQNGGDPYFTVREVYYGANGEPIGWAKATLGDETVEGCRKQLERILEDIKGWSLGQPVLKADDIPVPTGAHPDEFDEAADIVIDKRLKTGAWHIDGETINLSELFIPIAKKEKDK